MDEYVPPMAIGLHVAEIGGKIAWGLASGSDHSFAEVLPDDTSTKTAFLAGFEALLRRPELTGVPIDLYCASEEVTAALTEYQTAFPHITVHPWNPMTTRGLHVRAAMRAAATALQTSPVGRPAGAATGDVGTGDARTPIIAATDGSSGSTSGMLFSGWGWITNTGLHDCGVIASSSILAAEITAIKMLLKSLRTDAPLTILTDSKRALSIVTALRDGVSPNHIPPFPGSVKCQGTLRALAYLLADRDVTFVWVPSHTGQPLNEGADRLAVYARRAAQAQMDPDSAVYRNSVRAIVAETRDLLSEQPPQALATA